MLYSYTMVTNFGISVIYIPRKVRTTQSKNSGNLTLTLTPRNAEMYRIADEWLPWSPQVNEIGITVLVS